MMKTIDEIKCIWERPAVAKISKDGKLLNPEEHYTDYTNDLHLQSYKEEFRKSAIEDVNDLGCGDEPNQCGWKNGKKTGENLCCCCATEKTYIMQKFNIKECELK